MKRFAAASLLVVSSFVGVFVLTPQAEGWRSCSVRWGSLAKEVRVGSTAELFDVRAGRHYCFDRLVLDVAGPVNGYSVQYVDEVVMDGSGEPVPMRGGAYLQVIAFVPTI